MSQPMTHIDTINMQSRLPRPPLSALPQQIPHSASGLGFGSNLAQDNGTPSSTPLAVFLYGPPTGTSLIYLESMLKQLLLKTPQNGWSYGVLLSDHTLQPRDRIRINGETVDSRVFERCAREFQRDLDKEGGYIGHRKKSTAKQRVENMLVNVALRVFDSQKVTAIAIAMAHPMSDTDALACASLEMQGASKDTSDSSYRTIEQLVLDIYTPDRIICGFEPLSEFLESLPGSWRKSLGYLARRPIHMISWPQPNAVRMQLLNLAMVLGNTIELVQPLSSLPAAKDAWAHHNGLLRLRTHTHGVGEYTTAMALSTMRQVTKQTITFSPFHAQNQTPLRDTPPWMLRGLSNAASGTGQWHYSWAETPSDFKRTGEWFGGVCQKNHANPRVLLIHLPESFISTVRCRRGGDGQWVSSDYREMLKSLYLPLRNIKWACCVFAADILYESNVIESNVPPVLSQYVLREYWSQISGQQTEQIFIAPSLASALKLIASTCATRINAMLDRSLPSSDYPSRTVSPVVGSESTIFEHSSRRRPSQLLQPSPSGSNIMSMTTRPSRALSRATGLKNATSMDSLRESRRKFSLGMGNSGSESTISLPLRNPMATVSPGIAPMTAPMAGTIASTPKVDILVTGAKSFVQSTILVAQNQTCTP
ncbi:hypothetical protein BX661DRAFT_184769 [Kickxella alabastrina]|uniref:uncharacterized protein n=1 Tax=Kickxella alabastrina TaxID=61397 RepID=UPI0022203769|nr:uncharacterized protein BX661DRAFT_184769 [Kickxella alabastrina]KAI7825530.1 hypothetical protein BX661DRAFT_184769 [Kickxella alabastrina]